MYCILDYVALKKNQHRMYVQHNAIMRFLVSVTIGFIRVTMQPLLATHVRFIGSCQNVTLQY